MRQIAITGGAGYVASRLLPMLKGLPLRVHIIDKKEFKTPILKSLGPQFQFHRADLSCDSTVASLLSKVEAIIHLAALVGYPACDKNPAAAEACNVTATQNIMNWKGSNTRVFFSSTVSNYGPHKGRVDENSALLPPSLYGVTKKVGEEIVLKDSQSIVYRFAGAFGVAPEMRFDNLIHDFCKRAFEGEVLSVYESYALRQFVHVEDMASAILFALEHWPSMQGNVFNVGNPRIEITKKQVLEAIAQQVSGFRYVADLTGADKERRNYPISFEKIIKQGFEFKKQLREGISEFLSYLEERNKESNHYDKYAA